ncbi:MAG: hypothetical protein CMP53_09305 [Flavobacteriales bacterium]|nr:hypothetical protein [Flavobacteriales bacterium]
MIKMVTPQQRGQVVVKSIGDINRESTVRARPMGSRFAQAAGAAQGIAGIADTAKNVLSIGGKGLSGYKSFAGSRLNWLAIGLMYGMPSTRRFAVPQKSMSMVANIPNYLFTGHVLGSSLIYGLDIIRGKN